MLRASCIGSLMLPAKRNGSVSSAAIAKPYRSTTGRFPLKTSVNTSSRFQSIATIKSLSSFSA